MKRFLLSTAAVMLLTAFPALADMGSGDPPYSFQTVISPLTDPAFTQLLGINNASVISGYDGDGAIFPNKGLTLVLPNSFTPENFPGSAQTQVVGINNKGDTAGFYIDTGGVTHGFTDIGGTFATVDNPGTMTDPSVLTQLLGINDSDETAGYWQDAGGVQFPFTELGGVFTGLDALLPANTSAQATDVNNSGQVSGFFVDPGGVTHGFLLNGTTETTINFPGATLTQVLGLNNVGQLSGFYMDATGTHGFVDSNGVFQSLDDPNGIGTTTINGINDKGQVVGFYVAANGNTNGLVATPVPEPGTTILFGTVLAGLALLLRKRYNARGQADRADSADSK